MELRIVELAHKKGLTMSDMAKMIGISRVNLSNSLNGNPTLSRLREVAKILNVEVAELFKPTEQVGITGYLDYNDKIIKVDNVSTLRSVMAEVDSNAEYITLERETIDSLMLMKKAFEKTYAKTFSLDTFLMQMSASVEEGDIAVWEEFCKLTNGENE